MHNNVLLIMYIVSEAEHYVYVNLGSCWFGTIITDTYMFALSFYLFRAAPF